MRSIKTDVKDNVDKGDAREIVNLPIKCDDFQTAYSSDFLLPALRFADGEIKLSFARNAKGYPLQLMPSENGVQVKFIVQSMRF